MSEKKKKRILPLRCEHYVKIPWTTNAIHRHMCIECGGENLVEENMISGSDLTEAERYDFIIAAIRNQRVVHGELLGLAAKAISGLRQDLAALSTKPVKKAAPKIVDPLK